MSSRIERIVLDTNVVVSAFLNPAGAPAQVLTLILAGELSVLFDARILDEYAEVLARPRFSLEAADVGKVLRQIEADGERVAPSLTSVRLPDADDLPFLEVAISGKADALVTGNTRHFPGGLGVDVLSPRAVLQRLDAEQWRHLVRNDAISSRRWRIASTRRCAHGRSLSASSDSPGRASPPSCAASR